MVAVALVPAAIAIAGRFFPSLLGKIAGDRAEEIAQKVVNTAAGIAGIPPDSSPEDIINAIGGDAEAQLQLRLSLAEVQRDVYEMELEDRRSARDSQEKRGSERGNAMLIGVVVGLVACVAAVVWPRTPEAPLGNGELALLTTIAGALLKMLSDAFAFEFGSSRGSKEKDTQISEFKQALVQAGQERQSTTREIIRSQATQLRATEQALVQTAVAGGAAAVARAEAGPRDFVGELLRDAMA
jgi:hypothetical protein